MKMNVKLILALFLIALSSAAFWACDSDPKNARLQVWLTDAPGDYDAVHIDIQGVEVHSNANAPENAGGWVELNVNEGVYNLLELTNGIDTLLGEVSLPAGRISQIRLILGDNNSVTIDNVIYPLATPSAQQSGLKLQVHENLLEGITYKILLDFDAARSIVTTGNGEYSLKPVIRTITEAQNGAIKGVVNPVAATPAIYAINNLDTVATTFSDTTTGHFLLRGLPAGTYKVVFIPNGNYQKLEKTGISVQVGVVTDMDTVQIAQ